MPQCISVHANTHLVIWGLIPLMMCRAATFRRAPQEEHYYANLFVFPTKHEVVALEKSPRSAHLCFTPPRLIIMPFHQRLCEATPSDREQREGCVCV